jgi:hypothetical protein
MDTSFKIKAAYHYCLLQVKRYVFHSELYIQFIDRWIWVTPLLYLYQFIPPWFNPTHTYYLSLPNHRAIFYTDLHTTLKRSEGLKQVPPSSVDIGDFNFYDAKNNLVDVRRKMLQMYAYSICQYPSDTEQKLHKIFRAENLGVVRIEDENDNDLPLNATFNNLRR